MEGGLNYVLILQSNWDKELNMDLQQQNKHLYIRAGFGISVADYANARPIAEVVDKLFATGGVGELAVVTDEEWAKNSPKAMKGEGDKVARKKLGKEFREHTKELNLMWVKTMVNSRFPLLEKTALFWHGHFATHVTNPYYNQQLLNVLRQNALGNFGDLLRGVSKSAAMLQFLNNRQNKKAHPNENFARELMELFTLGRGHYTEDDVKAAARAFTGWSFDEEGVFVFRERQHDNGEKRFLGKTGNFNGDDILEILLQQKQTAIFITQKVYRYFVSDEQIDTKIVQSLANSFYNSNYNIGLLLREIFSSDWFYGAANIGAKIKSPIELLVGYERMLPMQFSNDKMVLNLQRILGQYLFNPPNVAGWPGGKSWIDSSSLVIRMRLPEAFFKSEELNLNLKDPFEETLIANKRPMDEDGHPSKQFKLGKVDVDWTAYAQFWKQYSKENMPQRIASYLLAVSISKGRLNEVIAYADGDSIDEYIKSLTILLMALPEYQLA